MRGAFWASGRGDAETRPTYAQVVVDVPARRTDKCYDYIIPDNLIGKIVPGSRVMVPFGQRSIEGFVVGATDSSEVENLREIIGPVKNAPPLPADLIPVARWMADTYMCLLIDALRAMVPSGTRVESSVVVTLTAGEEELRAIRSDRAGAGRLTGAARRVLDYLSECGGSATRDEISGALDISDVGRRIAALERAGLVETETAWMPPKVRPRTVRGYRLADHVGDPRLMAASIERRSPAQAAMLRAFAALGAASASPAPSHAPSTAPAASWATPAAESAATPRAGRPRPEERPAFQRDELLREAGCSASALDALVRSGNVERVDVVAQRDPSAGLDIVESAPPVLTEEQDNAVRAIIQMMDSGGGSLLVHGVTSSGKTEVYLRAIEHAIRLGKQGILLVPDISLTPQMVDRVMARFGRRVAVLHSALGAGERLDEWERIRRGDVDVVVGARSAVFAPVPSLAIIVIDEEHDSSYKQDESPRYHARDVAVFRAKLAGAAVVLGSATPSLETYFGAETGEISRVEMPRRIDDRPMPEIAVVDMRAELKSGNRTIFSRTLRDGLGQALSEGRQAILFMNRRGFSTFVLCRDCGYVVECPNCDVSLTYHARTMEMRCHYCDYVERVPDVCPSCGSRRIRYFGAGTERIEEEVKNSFPEARVVRMDVDTTRRKGAHRAILEAFRARRTDILVGTQMVAKGLDFPNVTLVGVVSADTALNLPDFRAAERTFQLISQVAGRSGRGEAPGLVVVQTYNPEHYSITAAARHDYRAFYEAEMADREPLGYPPVRRLLRILLSGPDEAATERTASRIAARCEESELVASGAVTVRGPAQAPIPRIAGKYRYHVLLFAGTAEELRAVALAGCSEGASGVTISLNVDPASIL